MILSTPSMRKWNPKADQHFHCSLPPVPILRQMTVVHVPKIYFPKIHFNTNLPSIMPRPSELSPPFRLSNQNVKDCSAALICYIHSQIFELSHTF